jgi:hypothetical protein
MFGLFEPRNSPFPRSKRNSRRRLSIPAFRTKFPSTPRDSRLPSEIPVHPPRFPPWERNSRPLSPIPAFRAKFPSTPTISRGTTRLILLPLTNMQARRTRMSKPTSVDPKSTRTSIITHPAAFGRPQAPFLHCHERPESQQPNYRGVATTKAEVRRRQRQGRLVRGRAGLDESVVVVESSSSRRNAGSSSSGTRPCTAMRIGV